MTRNAAGKPARPPAPAQRRRRPPKPPPSIAVAVSDVAERELLGSVLVANHLAPQDLPATVFHDPRHAKVWTWILEDLAAGRPADLVTLTPRAMKNGVGAAYLAELTNHASPGADRVAYTAGCLRKLAARRRLQAAYWDAEQTLADPSAEPDLEHLAEALGELRRPRAGSAVFLDGAPAAIKRPLALVGGTAYGASWPYVRGEDGREGPELVVVRDDGRLFSEAGLEGAEALDAIGLTVSLPEIPPEARTWSGAGVRAYLAGERPDPCDVFERLRELFAHYMDFGGSFGSQRELEELSALVVLTSYMLPAFNVAPYLQPTGGAGSGKTQWLLLACELAYLATVVLSSSSSAVLRDLAAYGAFLGFDDAEALTDPKKRDPLKSELLLSGQRRGSNVAIKEPSSLGDGSWVTKYIDAFAPRAFSAIKLPDPVLASRTILLPLLRSGDRAKTCRNPLDHDSWPHPRRRLVDDLWALALAHLPTVRRYDAAAPARVRLRGRDLDPWRAPLALALWLQEEHGAAGLFARLEALSVRYQGERADLEGDDSTRLCLEALGALIPADHAGDYTFETGELCRAINARAKAEGLTEGDADYTTERRLGKLLQRLRFRRAPRGKTRRRWEVSREDLEARLRAYGLAHGEAPPCAETDTAGAPPCGADDHATGGEDAGRVYF